MKENIRWWYENKGRWILKRPFNQLMGGRYDHNKFLTYIRYLIAKYYYKYKI